MSAMGYCYRQRAAIQKVIPRIWYDAKANEKWPRKQAQLAQQASEALRERRPGAQLVQAVGAAEVSTGLLVERDSKLSAMNSS